MVMITKTWNFPDTSQMNIIPAMTSKSHHLHPPPKPALKTLTGLKIQLCQSLHKILWMLFSPSRLKSIGFTCPQIPLHYQFVRTLFCLPSLESMLLKIPHHSLSFSCPASVAILTLALLCSLDLWIHSLSHLMQAFMGDYVWALRCLSSVIIPGFLSFSYSPCVSLWKVCKIGN